MSWKDQRVGDILSGHDPESLIHLTTASESELATGVDQMSHWVKLKDVSHLTVEEFQKLVVGPCAAGHSEGVAGFAVVKPSAAVFEVGPEKGLANITELQNISGPVKPDSYTPLPGKSTSGTTGKQ
jgi:hypothetical protein